VVSGPHIISFKVPDATDPSTFARLRILHSEEGTLVDRTILSPDSPSPNFGTKTISARVDSLSPFVIALVDAGISPIKQSFSATGGSGSINVTAADGISWTAVSNSSFLTITGSSNTGSGIVSYTVAPNSSTEGRTGTLTIAGQTFTVTQAGAAPPTPLKISPIVECVTDNGDGTFSAWMGYDNPNPFEVLIPVGEANKFAPSPEDWGQPVLFLPGRQRKVFRIRIRDNGNVIWILDGQTARASERSTLCPQ
jgi:hypothetical protein